MSKRDLGNLGESEFEKWCSHKGITVNRSINDKKGWDFFIQSTPDDIEKPNIESLIQVKSTEAEKIKIPIKLTNWKNLSTTSLPAFFLILKYGASENPEKAYLVHVDRSSIIRTLTALRRMNVKNQAHKISKKTYQIQMNKAIELSKPFSDSFKNEIEKIIGDPLKYREEKQHIITRSGASKLRKVMISTQNNRPEDIIDWLLGLKKIEIKSIEEYSTRFGIEKKEEYREIDEEVSVPFIPHSHIDILIQGEQITEKATLPVIFRSVSLEEHWKFIIEGSGLEILFQTENKIAVSGHIKFDAFNENTICNLKQVIPKIKFEALLHKLATEQDMIQFYLCKDNKNIPLFILHPDSFLPSTERDEYIKTLIQFNKIIESVNLNNNVEVDPKYIFRYKESINSTYNMMVRNYEYEAKFDETVELPNEFDVPLIRSFFTGVNFIYIVGIVQFTENDKKEKCECCGRNKVFSSKFKILKKGIMHSLSDDEVDGMFKTSIFEVLKDCSNKLVYDNSIDLRGENDSLVSQDKFGLSF